MGLPRDHAAWRLSLQELLQKAGPGVPRARVAGTKSQRETVWRIQEPGWDRKDQRPQWDPGEARYRMRNLIHAGNWGTAFGVCSSAGHRKEVSKLWEGTGEWIGGT